jgi:hypothetical protein
MRGITFLQSLAHSSSSAVVCANKIVSRDMQNREFALLNKTEISIAYRFKSYFISAAVSWKLSAKNRKAQPNCSTDSGHFD